MFPNVRLMIVAIMASILGMSCGLGVFAAFRVNHDSFVRLPSATPPLQLAFSNIAPVVFKNPSAKDPAAADAAPSDSVAPFGARFEVNLPQSAGAAAPQPLAAPPARDTVAETPRPTAAAASEAGFAASPAAPPTSEAASAPPQALAAIEPGSETQTAPAPAPANDAGIAPGPAPEAQAFDNSVSAVPAPAAHQAGSTAGNVPAAATDNAVQAPAQAAVTDKPMQAPIQTAATEIAPAEPAPPNTEAAPAAASSLDSGKREETETGGANAPTKKPAHAAAKRQRIAAKPRRPRKARARGAAPSTAQYAGYSQPAFQSTYEFTSATQAGTARPRRSAKTARNSAARSATP